MSRVRGVVMGGMFEYVKERYGEDGFAELVRYLKSTKFDLDPANVDEKGFYDLADYTALNRAIDKVFGDGSGKLIEESARFTVTYSVFEAYNRHLGYRLKSLEDFLHALPKILLLFYESIETRIERTAPNTYSISSRVRGFEDPETMEVVRLRTLGWLKGVADRFSVADAVIDTEPDLATGTLTSTIAWG